MAKKVLVIGILHFSKTKIGHEMASQSPDFDDNCRKSYCGTRRVHLRPPRGPGRPKLARRSPRHLFKQILRFLDFPNSFSTGGDNKRFSKKNRHQSGRDWPDLDDTSGFKSWSLGRILGSLPAPGGPKKTRTTIQSCLGKIFVSPPHCNPNL